MTYGNTDRKEEEDKEKDDGGTIHEKDRVLILCSGKMKGNEGKGNENQAYSRRKMPQKSRRKRI